MFERLRRDHGETLGERDHYFDHAGLHDNTTHVPLIVRWPDEARLSGELARWLEIRRSEAGTPQPLDVGEEEEKQLESLGYIE